MKLCWILGCILCLAALPTIFFSFFGTTFQEPERNSLKIEANEELKKKFREILPPGAKVARYPWDPHLRAGHRPTCDMFFEMAFPDVLMYTQEEALSFFVSYLDKIIDIMNNTPKIRPYLETFPIDPSKLCVSIVLNYQLDEKNGLGGQENGVAEPGRPYIGAITFQSGKISGGWRVYDEATCKWGYQKGFSIPAMDIFNKSFQEHALRPKLKIETSILPCTQYEKQYHEGVKVWCRFFEQYAQKMGYVYLWREATTKLAETTMEERRRQRYSATYCAQDRRLMLEEAQSFVRQALQEHILFFKNNNLAIKDMKYQQEIDHQPVDGKIGLENFSMRFIYWDKYIDRVRPPYIAEIYTFGKKIYYYTADECQRLVLVAQEELPDGFGEE